MNFENSIYHQGNTRKELPHEIEFEDINTDITKKPVQINKKRIKILVVGDVCTGKTFFLTGILKMNFAILLKLLLVLLFSIKISFGKIIRKYFLIFWKLMQLVHQIIF